VADIKITEKLASIIKTERLKKKLSAKDLSKYIDKSDSYISTLERNKIDYIKEDLLFKIFEKISNSSDKELNEYINNILADTFLDFKLNDKELKKQEWMLQLGLVIRKIPIPKSIIEFINESLIDFNKSELDLTRKINENTYFTDQENYETNKLYVQNDGSWAYRFKLEDNIITDILNKTNRTTNYITMLGIIYNIYLFKGEDNSNAQIKADLFLKEHKFYDLKQIIKVRQQHLNKEINKIDTNSDFSFELPKYEMAFDEALTKIKKYINQLRDINIDSAYSIVKAVESNIDNDSGGFMNVIYSIPFSKLLKDCTKEQKQEFLSNLSKLIASTIEKNKSNSNQED